MIGHGLAACAAFVAPATLDAVVQVESGGNELARILHKTNDILTV